MKLRCKKLNMFYQPYLSIIDSAVNEQCDGKKKIFLLRFKIVETIESMTFQLQLLETTYTKLTCLLPQY